MGTIQCSAKKQLFTEVEVASGGTGTQSGDTKVNNCFSIYQNSEIIEHQNDDFQHISCCQGLQFWRAMTERPRP